MASLLVKAIYDYQATDLKVLHCSGGERFIIIKQTEPRGDWLYVVNSKGKLGYIPANYTESDSLDDLKLLELIDTIISVLDADHNDPKIITTRQINHAQVKLTQLRCEVISRQQGKKTITTLSTNHDTNGGDEDKSPMRISTDEMITLDSVERRIENNSNQQNPDKNGLDNIESKDKPLQINDHDNRLNLKSAVEKSEFGVQVDLFEPSPKSSEPIELIESNLGEESTKITTVEIDDSLAAELIERVRVSTELSHGMCKLTIETVMNFLREQMPLIEGPMTQLFNKLEAVDQCPSPLVMKNSSDLIKLRGLFDKLWICKADEQQRGWPIHDDEEMETSLIEMVKLLANANPTICREAMFTNNCDNVYMIISYFHEETKKSLKMQLYSVLMEIIRLNDNMIEDTFLSTVLPASLANEMINHRDDIERWSKASILFTYVFGSGQKPPINMYEHVNEKFVNSQLNLIEGEDIEGNKIDHKIPPEMSIPPILAYNLHFDLNESNLVLKALKMRPNVKCLIENLVSYLNWEEDPTLLINYFGKPMKTCDRPNAVHKLLTEVFEDADLANLCYYNDVRVMIDILVSHLNNIQPGDENRFSYLKLLYNIIKNSNYKEEPHKLEEVTKCVDNIYCAESTPENEKRMVRMIKELLSAETV